MELKRLIFEGEHLVVPQTPGDDCIACPPYQEKPSFPDQKTGVEVVVGPAAAANEANQPAA